MKHHLLSATLAGSLLFAALSTDVRADPSIDGYQWNKRLLITFANNASSPALTKQRAWIDSDKTSFTERDLIAIEVIGDTVKDTSDSAAVLRRRYDVPDSKFRVLLIGKDGGVKMQSQAPIEPQRLFGTIDAMPMRRDEARRPPKS